MLRIFRNDTKADEKINKNYHSCFPEKIIARNWDFRQGKTLLSAFLFSKNRQNRRETEGPSRVEGGFPHYSGKRTGESLDKGPGRGGNKGNAGTPFPSRRRWSILREGSARRNAKPPHPEHVRRGRLASAAKEHPSPTHYAHPGRGEGRRRRGGRDGADPTWRMPPQGIGPSRPTKHTPPYPRSGAWRWTGWPVDSSTARQ